jgi:hypothetical protein
VREAVGETESVELALRVEVGVGVGVPVPVPVDVGGVVALGVEGGVPLLDKELLPVLDGLAPEVSEAVGEHDTVVLG